MSSRNGEGRAYFQSEKTLVEIVVEVGETLSEMVPLTAAPDLGCSVQGAHR